MGAEYDAGFVVWLTGLSGAGKSTVAHALVPELERAGRRVELLDGDAVRTHLSAGLGFSRADRDANVARLGWVAGLVARHGGAAVVAAISPYRAARDAVRAAVPNFVEVHAAASVEVCAARDVKGLYARARRGEIAEFTGVSDPYEPPTNAEVTVDSGREGVAESVARVMAYLRERGLLS